MLVSKKVILSILIFMILGESFAQIVPPPIPPPPPPGLPIDSFVELLLLVGIVYGMKKIFKNSSS